MGLRRPTLVRFVDQDDGYMMFKTNSWSGKLDENGNPLVYTLWVDKKSGRISCDCDGSWRWHKYGKVVGDSDPCCHQAALMRRFRDILEEQ